MCTADKEVLIAADSSLFTIIYFNSFFLIFVGVKQDLFKLGSKSNVRQNKSTDSRDKVDLALQYADHLQKRRRFILIKYMYYVWYICTLFKIIIAKTALAGSITFRPFI